HRAGLDRLVSNIERLGVVLESTMNALEAAKHDIEGKPAGGGFGGMWRMLADAENQESLRFLLAFAHEFRKGIR
ncbi:MAG TPA: hypothetical protein VET46_15085, partial [Steroidobacteraceae bacterium]|nr:hypothetical protein [Steroidobacteraceae bacterium]